MPDEGNDSISPDQDRNLRVEIRVQVSPPPNVCSPFVGEHSGAFRPNEIGRRESNHFSPACLQNSIMCNQDDDRKSLQNAGNKKDRESEIGGWTDTKEEGEREGETRREKDKCGAIFRQVDFNGRRILITFTE